jgi:hypothetical protein
MHRILRNFMLALIFIAVASHVQAKLPFSDNFSGSTLDPNVWKVSDGNWSVSNGVLSARNSDRARGENDPLSGWPYGTFDYVVALGIGTNMTVTVDAKPIKMGDTFDSDGNVLDNGRVFRRMGIMVHSNGAAQFADKKWTALWGLMNETSLGYALLEEAVAWRQMDPDVQLEMGKTYTFKLEVQGKHVKAKVWEKGTTEPDWQIEDDFANQLTADGVGLLGVGFDVDYSNFNCVPIEGAKGTITGVVTDDSTGKPIAGASVTNGDAVVTTDANGKYSISVVPGSVGLTASAPNYITAEASDTIDVSAGDTATGADISLKPDQLPLDDNFNGGGANDWQVPTSGDFNGDWNFTDNAYVASNMDLLADFTPPALPAQGLYDYTYLPDVGSDVTYTAKVTPMGFSDKGFARIGLATHMNGSGGSADKKWMLLYGVLDNQADKPMGLSLLEEGVAWGAQDTSVKLDIGKTYVFKLANYGTDVRGKVWEDGTPEPSQWQVKSTFSLNQIYAAGIGLLGVGANVKYDDVHVESNPGFAPAVMVGDLNADGKIAVADATLSLRIAVGLLTPTDDQKAAGDVNKDGKLTVSDTTLILQVAVGIKSGF